jgi:YgiT-type zinc finger domain-containing protein
VHYSTATAHHHHRLPTHPTEVDNANPTEEHNMKCSIEGCPGEYEEREIVHTVRYHDQVVVIDHVPAEVCPICGDVLLKPETVRQIEILLQTETCPASMVPLYEYA